MKYLLSSLILLTIMSCDKHNSSENTYSYFGGEIINPKSAFVLFLKDDKVIDTIFLNKNNRFISKFKDLKEGLYTFKHGVEFQYVYMQPTDSILVRLNTWNFDESMVFSGKGGSKNEFLINLFLQNEKEDIAMYQYFNLNENDFQFKVDSLAQKRVAIYNDFAENENEKLTDNFRKLTNAAIYFPLYRLKEIYPYYYKISNNKQTFPKINKNFYKFRDKINLNEASLVSFYPYQNYVVSYLYNLSYQKHHVNSQNLTNTILKEIVANVKLQKFKNTLLKRIVVNDFLKNETTCRINEKTLALFLESCTNPAYRLQITNLVHDSKYVENGKPFHNFKVKSYSNKTKNITDIIKNKNTVIYFWSTEFMSSDYLVSRIKYLESKYSSTLFIGIHLQNTNEDITKDPKLKVLDINKQFILTPNSYAQQYLTSNYPRAIIINKDGVVVNGFTYLGANSLNAQLSKLELN